MTDDISLRDRIALAALPAIVAKYDHHVLDCYQKRAEFFAARAYQQADAMLAERRKSDWRSEYEDRPRASGSVRAALREADEKVRREPVSGSQATLSNDVTKVVEEAEAAVRALKLGIDVQDLRAENKKLRAENRKLKDANRNALVAREELRDDLHALRQEVRNLIQFGMQGNNPPGPGEEFVFVRSDQLGQIARIAGRAKDFEEGSKLHKHILVGTCYPPRNDAI